MEKEFHMGKDFKQYNLNNSEYLYKIANKLNENNKYSNQPNGKCHINLFKDFVI